MNRGRGRPTGACSSPRGRSLQSDGHSSYRNRHMNGADGAFSDINFISRDGMSHGRRGNAHHISPGSYLRRSSHRPTPVLEYRPKKPIGDGTFNTESLQQDLNALNVSDCESKQSVSSVASNSAFEGDFGSLSACSSSQDTQLDQTKLQVGQEMSRGAVDGRTSNLDISLKVNITESQLSLQSGTTDGLSQEQRDKSTDWTGDSRHAEHLPLIKPFDICLPETGAPMSDADGAFFDGNFSSRDGMSHGRRGNAHHISPGSYLRRSNHRHAPVLEYRPKKPIGYETFHTESLQQDLNALNVSDCESKKSVSSVASNSAFKGDFGSLSACLSSQDTQLDQTKLQVGQALSRGAVDGRTSNLDISLKVNITEYRPKKPIGDETFHTESVQQDLNALNVSDCESKQSVSSVASNSAFEGDFGSLSACSSSQDTQLDQTKLQVGQALSRGAVDGRTSNLDISLKVNITESQLSLQSGTTDGPSQEQRDKSTDWTGDSRLAEHLPVIKPFDICLPKTGAPVMLKSSLFSINKDKRNESKRLALEGQEKILRPGMVLLKGYLSTDDQVKIVKLCRDLGLGPGGFYQPGYRDGAKLQLKMMCLGKNWDPDTSMYGEHRSIDGAKPPNIPPEFHQLVEKAVKHSLAFVSKTSSVEDIPWISPDLCIVNFYSASGRLGLHQDKDESEGSLRKGLPVVSFSIGDAGEFLYSDNRDEKNANNILLESGDVVIFGGKSRHIFHGVRAIHKNTAPKSLLEETNLCPGRLNLTFRQY